ncbi:MAG: HAD-IIA family hydrolase [Actinomycetes bacterium]
MPAMAWVLDLDGVVWLGDQPVPGAADAVAGLRERGTRVVFLTNNSSRRVGEYVERLGAMGIPVEEDDILTSAQAAASLVEPGTTALVCGGPGVEEALRKRGVHTVAEGPADTVVVGWHREFDFGRLTAATSCVLGGARLVGTNEDATFPTSEGLLPGAGAILAAVAFATGAEPTVAGKPHQPVADLLAGRVKEVDLMVGDRPSTDGLLARRLHTRFGLVLTGVTPAGHGPVDPAPDVEADDLAALVATGGTGGTAGAQLGAAQPGAARSR